MAPNSTCGGTYVCTVRCTGKQDTEVFFGIEK